MFVLGKKSLANLEGVHPKLVMVVKRAIEITVQDFTVQDGLRTVEEQRQLVARGASKTMNSRHLPQRDGYGHAVDLVPWINGQPRWEWEPIYDIAAAVQEAAAQEGVALRWGGVWDRRLGDLPSGREGLKRAVADYCRRHPGPDFIDGPHYELA